MRQTVPAELSSFIGRERELAAVAKLLAVERLVTLTGPAGIGKTRLAVRTVRSLNSSEGTDVCWADLARLDPPRLPELEAELLAALAGREVLLVLDGCEQLRGQAGGLAGRLLAVLPGLRILATSQRRLGLREEAASAVPPLSLPAAPGAAAGPVGRMPVAEIAGYAAVRLFEERARGADPFFALTERNAGAVAALCRALDGIPGALELAAGRSHQYAPDQALRRLAADPLTFLAGGAGRGTRVDAERSHRLAPPAERLLRERLSVFAGSFDLAAAAEVCGFGVLTRESAAEVLHDLVPGLLADGTGPDRYRLPLSVRAHAARLLAHGPAGEGATAARRHHERCRVLAERAAQLWREGAQQEARALALRELPELRVAMNPLSAAGPAAALEIAVSLWFLWSACGLTEEGRRHVERALALHPAPRPARALWLAAWLVASLGEAAAADPLLVEAWSAAVQEGEDTCLAYLAHVRGTVALWEERYEDAAAEFLEGLELLPEQPEFGPGREALRAAHTMALAHTDPASVPVEAGPSGLPSALPGDPPSGLPGGPWSGLPSDLLGGPHSGPPRGPRAGAGDPWACAWSEFSHAMVHRHGGRPAEARAALLRTLRTLLALGDGVGQAFAVEVLAELEADRGRFAEAARLLGCVSRTRPAAAPAPRAERVLRARLTPEAFRSALREGARTPLHRLLPEL
ncbi:ATP-binding protein [Streptomyces sp. NPDC085524]|uniref:ATP-binding protein n=1 Tax=Streptomyces sp. NPDC085524 TaxID=3365728 RepID=UPI0037D341D4